MFLPPSAASHKFAAAGEIVFRADEHSAAAAAIAGEFFRELLAMTPKEQEKYLTNRPPEIRGRILAKIHEYQALDSNEREMRLRATELRWYLLPLLRECADQPCRPAGGGPG